MGTWSVVRKVIRDSGDVTVTLIQVLIVVIALLLVIILITEKPLSVLAMCAILYLMQDPQKRKERRS